VIVEVERKASFVAYRALAVIVPNYQVLIRKLA
jgi:hypothetical protein